MEGSFEDDDLDLNSRVPLLSPGRGGGGGIRGEEGGFGFEESGSLEQAVPERLADKSQDSLAFFQVLVVDQTIVSCRLHRSKLRKVFIKPVRPDMTGTSVFDTNRSEIARISVTLWVIIVVCSAE